MINISFFSLPSFWFYNSLTSLEERLLWWSIAAIEKNFKNENKNKITIRKKKKQVKDKKLKSKLKIQTKPRIEMQLKKNENKIKKKIFMKKN